MRDIDMDLTLRSALDYATQGWPVLPCDPSSGNRCKSPLIARDLDEAGSPIPRTGGLYKATTDEQQLRAWWSRWPNAMIGVRTGETSGLFVIDLDVPKASGEPDGVAAWAALVEQHGGMPPTRTHRTPSSSMHVFFRWRRDRPVTNREGRLPPGINVRGKGGYIIMPPSRLSDGGRYEIIEPTGDADIADAPDWLYSLLGIQICEQGVHREVGSDHIAVATASDRLSRYVDAASASESRKVAMAEQGKRNIILNRAAFSLGTLVPHGALTPSQITDHLIEAATRCGLVAEDGLEIVRATIASGVAAGIEKPRVLPGQKEYSGRAEGQSAGGRQDASPGSAGSELADPLAITQDSVAQRLADRYAGELRFCHHTGAWFRWTGTHWRRDDTNFVFQLVRELAREVTRGEDPKLQKDAGKASFSSGVERFARVDPGFATTSVSWDKDPFLLGTLGGTLDLKTGVLRPAKPADGITRITALAPAETADCPQRLKFLNQVTAGDQDLIRFLQQWCGYALTGDIGEHALVFIYGPGGNGKGVFLNTLTGILGDYAVTAPMDTFTALTSDRHPTDLAMLRGARLVTASETEEGNAWAESRIKQMTGGDPITARFMRQDFFTYRPQFKLTIIGNHKPMLRNIDEAIRRRFNILPFIHKPAVPDRDLEAKLRREWPAILRWMIEGCLDWQANRLIRCDRIVAETETYFADQDLLGQWLDEECDTEPGNPHKTDTVAGLFQSWSAYPILVCLRDERGGEGRQQENLLGGAPAERVHKVQRRQWGPQVSWTGAAFHQVRRGLTDGGSGGWGQVLRLTPYTRAGEDSNRMNRRYPPLPPRSSQLCWSRRLSLSKPFAMECRKHADQTSASSIPSCP